jgi:hypothetical protein
MFLTVRKMKRALETLNYFMPPDHTQHERERERERCLCTHNHCVNARMTCVPGPVFTKHTLQTAQGFPSPFTHEKNRRTRKLKNKKCRRCILK